MDQNQINNNQKQTPIPTVVPSASSVTDVSSNTTIQPVTTTNPFEQNFDQTQEVSLNVTGNLVESQNPNVLNSADNLPLQDNSVLTPAPVANPVAPIEQKINVAELTTQTDSTMQPEVASTQNKDISISAPIKYDGMQDIATEVDSTADIVEAQPYINESPVAVNPQPAELHELVNPADMSQNTVEDLSSLNVNQSYLQPIENTSNTMKASGVQNQNAIDLNNVLNSSQLMAQPSQLNVASVDNSQNDLPALPEIKMLSNPFDTPAQPQMNTQVQSASTMYDKLTNITNNQVVQSDSSVNAKKNSSTLTTLLSILTVLGILLLVTYIVVLLVPDLKDTACEQFSSNATLEDVFSCAV